MHNAFFYLRQNETILYEKKYEQGSISQKSVIIKIL